MHPYFCPGNLCPSTYPPSPPLPAALPQLPTSTRCTCALRASPARWPRRERKPVSTSKTCRHFLASRLSPWWNSRWGHLRQPQRPSSMVSVPGPLSAIPRLFPSGRFTLARERRCPSAPPRSVSLSDFHRLRKGETGRPELNRAGPFLFRIFLCDLCAFLCV